MKIVKFGGTSLASGPQLEKVINIIKSDPERQVVVVSAPGKRFANDIKATDLLITYANKVLAHEDLTEIQKLLTARYTEIAEYFDLPTDQVTPIVEHILNLPKQQYPSHEFLLAAFKAHGERLNGMLTAKIMTYLGIPAKFLNPDDAGITVEGSPNDATISEESYAKLNQIEVGNERIIVPGFFGYTNQHEIATFARGGSDITGAIMARGLHADLYENFTDVDAIYYANPAVVEHAFPIDQMSYVELRELSYAGFSVFQNEAIIPAIQGKIPINVKNTNHPDRPGTMIVPKKDALYNRPITGVAGSSRFSALYLHRYLLNKETGFTLKLLQIFYKYGVSYEHMPSGIDDLTVIFDKSHLTETTISKMCAEIKEALHPDQMEWIDNYAIIMVVGEGMRGRVGTLDHILHSLAIKNIGVRMINQGASRISIMIGVNKELANPAIKQIYHEFFQTEPMSL